MGGLERNWSPGSRAQFTGGNIHDEPWWFLTNGTTDPSSFSANIESVARVDDGASDNWYRITWKNPGSYNQFHVSDVNVTNLLTTQLVATIVTDGVPTGLAAPDGRAELDIGVFVSGATAYVNNHAAGHYVSGRIWMDCSDALTERY